MDDPEIEGAGALLLDVDAAFNKIKPNRAKEVPLLYRKDRYEKEWNDGLGDGIHPEHPDKIEHLGGSWFKGMAEQIESGKNGRNNLKFDRMIGRDDGDDDIEERLLEKALELGEGGGLPGNKGKNGQYDLDLDPKWEVVRQKETVDIRMKDPEIYPRFQDDLKVNQLV